MVNIELLRGHIDVFSLYVVLHKDLFMCKMIAVTSKKGKRGQRLQQDLLREGRLSVPFSEHAKISEFP